jgi:hypothetical protein
MSALGHFLPRSFVAVVAVVPLITDTTALNWPDRFVPIPAFTHPQQNSLLLRRRTTVKSVTDLLIGA